jgi:CDP-L-myo-inositol myo-inositolphosphotransferase
VDTRPAYADREGATRALLQSGTVVAVGKGLEPYDALDTGLFLCSGIELRQLAVPSEGKLSWNAVKRLWLESGRVIEACDLSGSAWIDVDCSPDLGRALEVVMATVGSGGEGFVSRHINRKLSAPVTRLLLPTPVTADQMSGIAFLTAAGGAAALLGNRWRLGSALVQLSSILDGCDGELARARLESSPRGAVLDATLDRWADGLVIAGMAIGARSERAHRAGYPALTGALLVPYTRAKMEAELGEMPWDLTRLGATRDVRLAALALGALAGRPLPTLAALAIASNIEVARRLFALGRVRGRAMAPFSESP